MMGNYHFGHIRALMEEGALPNIVSGTSAGSVVAAMLCTRTEEELVRDMRPEILEERLLCFSKPWVDRFRTLYERGHIFDFEDWHDMIKWLVTKERERDEIR